MPKLDKNKPYGETFGHPHVRYIQDGEKFTGGGEHIPAGDPRLTAERDTGVARAERKAAERQALKEAFKERLKQGPAVKVVEPEPKPQAKILDPETLELTPAIDEHGQVDNVPLEDLHWTKLRELAAEKGIEYQGKAKTIALIRQAGE